jgi:cobalamin biosynthesis protein CobT
MSTFNFIESFFMLSLGITFVLIVLLVYHFKQRLGSMEQKCDTMFDIVQNLVKELNMVKTKGDCMMRTPGYSQVNYSRVDEQDGEQDASEDEEQDASEDEEQDASEDEEQDASDDEEQDASEDEEQDASDDEEQDASDDEEQEEQSAVENSQPKVIEMSELLPEPEDIVIHKIMSTDYKKKTVAELKALAVEKGLATLPIKMSKTELLKLF